MDTDIKLEMNITAILTQATGRKASDVHLTVGRPPMIRLSGKLVPLLEHVLTAEDTQSLVFSMLTPEQQQRYLQDHELDLSYTVPDVSRFRVNCYFQKGGMAAALRGIPSIIPTMEEIGLPPICAEFIRLRNGLVLVTGPTGSGKSTTLAAMINAINRERECHILTIEDPIEFVYQHQKAMVNQREVGAHTRSFANALRSLLREDPNVVLVGEMRDLETIAATITIAETGHLVFGTLHTLDAAQTVDRIIDVFPPYQQQQIRAMLAGALRGVVCQQLIPRKDGKGRLAAREILLVTNAIGNMIREGKTHQIYSVIQTSGQLGMTTMEQSVNQLMQKGLITYETAVANVNDPKAITKPMTGPTAPTVSVTR